MIMKIVAVKKPSIKTEIIFLFETENSTIPCIQKLQAQGILSGKAKSIVPIFENDHRYVIVGLGKKEKLTTLLINKTIKQLYQQLKLLGITDVAVNTEQLGNQHIRVFIEGMINAAYVFEAYKQEKADFQLKHIEIECHDLNAADKEITIATAIANGQNYAKDLQNLPANICTTDYMLDQAKAMVKTHEKLNLSYIDTAKMHELGMGCITAVGKGSKMPNYIACMEYNGGPKDQKPIVLVGKGLVYDSGGLCLKPWKSMASMKMDMSGAAAVYGVIQAISELNLPINVVGAAALVENAIDGKSYRPGDILKSMQGLTVEVENTDAEGRLALCDTLTYIGKYNPKVVIDLATLTGAMVVALGADLSGLFSNNDKLISALQAAGEQSRDLLWHMPLFADYHEQLKSDVADINNIGGPGAGSITAALFLSRFTEKYHWAHLDIAGSAMGDFDKATGTGRPVPLITQYILNQCK